MKTLNEFITNDQIKGLADVLSPYFLKGFACDENALAKKEEIQNTYGSLDNFLKNCNYGLISGPRDPMLPEFHNFFTKMFPNPEEQETLDAFKEALALNDNKELKRKYGAFDTAMIYAKAPDSEHLLGGFVFSAFKMPEEVKRESGIDGTIHTTFLFIDPDYRKINIGNELFKLIEGYSKNFIAGAKRQSAFNLASNGKVLDAKTHMLGEQESPELMFKESGNDWYVKDPDLAIEQILRLRWANKIGFRRIDIPYIQPALRKGEKPCNILSFNIIDNNVDKIYNSVLQAHLDRFFTIDVFKGKNPILDETYRWQMNELKKKPSLIQTMSLKEYYSPLDGLMQSPVFSYNGNGNGKAK